MVEKVKEFKFNKVLDGLFLRTEEQIRDFTGDPKASLLDFINNNIEDVKSEGVFEDLSEREVALFVFALISSAFND